MKSAVKYVILPGIGLLFFGLSALAAIYGPDDRKEVIEDPTDLSRTRSTAIMISPVFYDVQPDGKIALGFDSLADTYGVCKNERFASQPSANINCTGFLVGPDLLVTAGHCMVNFGEAKDTVTPQCEDFVWLLDYQTRSDGSVQLKDVPADRIVRCKRVIHANVEMQYDAATDHTTHGADYALIQLDRKITDRAPFILSKTPPQVGDKVGRIGYPSGLPAKSIRGASVFKIDHPEYFYSDIDTLKGDSGGPVFNSSGEVIGITVRAFPGDYAYSSKQGCSRPNRCDLATGKCDIVDSEYPVGSQIQNIAPIRGELNRLGQPL